MRNFFAIRKSKASEQLRDWGILSQREGTEVIIAGESNGTLLISRLPRKASLENLRLQGKLRTIAPNYYARSTQINELRFEPGTEIDDIEIGLNYLEYLKKQKFSLEEKRVAYTFDQNNQILTSNSARKKDVSDASIAVEGFRARTDASCPVEVESRGRAALRLYLNQNVSEEESQTMAVCSVLIEEHGYSITFWSSERGICWEAEQPFAKEEQPEENWTAVSDEIRRLVAPPSLATLGLQEISKIILTAAPEVQDFLRNDLAEDDISLEAVQFVEGTHYLAGEGSLSLTDKQTEIIITAGLAIRDRRVPQINLNLDLEIDLRVRSTEKVKIVQQQTKTTNRNLAILVIAPVILAVACAGVFYATLFIKDNYVTKRQETAKQRENELQATINELQNVKNSADQVQKVGALIENLRKRQPANFLLLMSLNRIFPAGGSSWQIDEITSKQDGTVTIKGKTTSDAELSDFVKNLDFSPDFESVKASKDESASAGIVPANFAGDSGIKKFIIEARYLPLASTGTAKPGAPPAVAVPPQTPTANQPALQNPPQIAVQGTPRPPNG